MIAKGKLLGLLVGASAVFALSSATAGAAPAKTLLQLKAEAKPLAVGGEVLLVGGYSLGPCYWEEQEFKVAVNGAHTDKLTRVGTNGLVEGCDGGVKAVEITSAMKMVVKLSPLRIHVAGPCVYEYKEISGTFAQKEWGPEIAGTTVGKLDKAEKGRSAACAKSATTTYDLSLSGVETALVS